eukprot:CAMPEP_0113936258 /NCGR_PEP_ID=MMETSP1339-20121228/3212_1 /TAXON_ID=94617 /ORGANISM="Fibrocapsa japonica" /LENGTH=163 /DNA_ID=CAMNT_0000938665 /DNA_START=52 /DNA_END=543 /DNA_ORIENTATION=- /assembly_acc=CAM_ASM_000762
MGTRIGTIRPLDHSTYRLPSNRGRTSMIHALPAGYGYCLFSASLSGVIASAKANKMLRAQEDPSLDRKLDKLSVDRKNALEVSLTSLPLLLTMVLFGGFLAPKPAAVIGMIWNLGQVISGRSKVQRILPVRLASLVFILNIACLAVLGGVSFCNGLRAVSIVA